MSILVTGASGVLGSHVARHLAEKGHDVIALSSSGVLPHSELTLGAFADRVRFIKADIVDLPKLEKVVAEHQVEGIVHAAAMTGEAQARVRTAEMLSVNILGTANVLQVAGAAKLRRVVYIGSASEYGRRADLRPIREDEINPEGIYSESKYAGHRLGQRFRDVFGLDVVTARVTSVYGPNTRFDPLRKLVGNTLLAHLCRSIVHGQPVELEEGGDYVRDWTYAADSAAGVSGLYLAEKLCHTSYNISGGNSYSLFDVVAALRELAPEARIKVGGGDWKDDPFQALNLRGSLDITRAREDLGFKAAYSLKEGLAAYLDWWRALQAKELAAA